MGLTLLLCIERSFPNYRDAFNWVLRHVVKDGDEVHIVTLLPLKAYSASPKPASRRSKCADDNLEGVVVVLSAPNPPTPLPSGPARDRAALSLLLLLLLQ